MAPQHPHTWLRHMVKLAQDPTLRTLFPNGLRLCPQRPGPAWAADGMATALAPDGTPDASRIRGGGHVRLRAHEPLARLQAAFMGLRNAMAHSPLHGLGRFAVDVRHQRTHAVRLHFQDLDWSGVRDTAAYWHGVDRVAELLARSHSAPGRTSLHIILQDATTCAGACRPFTATRTAARVAAALMALDTPNGPIVPDLARHLQRYRSDQIAQPQIGEVPSALRAALERWKNLGENVLPRTRGEMGHAEWSRPAWRAVNDAMAAWNPTLLRHNWLSRWSMSIPAHVGEAASYGVEIAGCIIRDLDTLGAFAGANTHRPVVVSENMAWCTSMPFPSPQQAVSVYRHMHGEASKHPGTLDVWKALRPAPGTPKKWQ